jgi:hypothetical protein
MFAGVFHKRVSLPVSNCKNEKHDALTGNETFQDNLLHALLSLDQLERPAF